MGRPPTPVGTYGNINTTPKASGGHRAEAYIRMADGKSKRVRADAATTTAATNKLKTKLLELSKDIVGGEVTAETPFAQVAELWITEVAREYEQAGRSPDTIRQYRSYLRKWVIPSLGSLQCREINATNTNNLIQRCREQRTYAAANSLRSVLTGVCMFAVRNGAMRANPVKSTQRLTKGPPKGIKSLTYAQRVDLLAKLGAFAERRKTDTRGRSLGRRARIWTQLPDLVNTMLSTGVRVGELLALDGSDIDPPNRTVRLAHHIVRDPGKGLVRMRLRKGNEGELLLRVPEWSVPTWRRLKLAAGGDGPLFPAFSGEWLDPAAMVSRIREAFDACGYDWVTSHVFRKTVTSLLDDADISTTAIADQLGNTPAVVEAHYRKKRVANDATADVLESMMGDGAG